jgi:hypothetical protein
MFSCVVKSYIDNMTYNTKNDKKITTNTPTTDNIKPIENNISENTTNNNSDK